MQNDLLIRSHPRAKENHEHMDAKGTTASQAQCVIQFQMWDFSEERERGAASTQFTSGEAILNLNSN